MNGSHETKSEIRARIEELEGVSHMLAQDGRAVHLAVVNDRLRELRHRLELAQEDLFTAIIKSHKAVCAAKRMDEKDAFGNDPAVYYTLGLCGEAGEIANDIVKAQRNREGREERVVAAVKKELPDVFIYGVILAHVLDLNIGKLINDKVDVVCERAASGYYGGPLEAERGA